MAICLHQTSSKIEQKNEDETSDIKDLLSKDGSTKSQSSKTTGTSNIESSVLEKLKIDEDN